MLCFFDKKKKITWRFHYFTPVYQKSWSYVYSFWDIECDSVTGSKWQLWVIFCPPPPPPKKKKKRSPWKIRIRYFTYFHQKTQSYVVWFLRYSVRQIEFLSFWAIFCPFTTLTPEKSKFFEKNAWSYQHFTLVYPKWQSYDVWFVKYGVQQTQFFVILVYFLPF